MPNTTNYSFPTPADTDLVKNGADAICDLGDAVDTAMNTALGTKKAGMVLLNTTSFTAVASQAINNVFSSTYKNYFVTVSNIVVDSASDRELQMRLRVGGVDNSTASSYQSQSIFSYAASAGGEYLAQAQNFLINGNNVTPINGEMTLINPFTTGTTGLFSDFLSYRAGLSGGSYNTYKKSGLHNQSVSYDGFNLILASGTMTGKVSVYGYNE